jgi:hypothetical protein
VEGVGAGAVTQQLTEYGRAALLGGLSRLEHDHGSALAHHEAIATGVERTRNS